jgi:phosphoglycerate dehydrogenase-like enzyme
MATAESSADRLIVDNATFAVKMSRSRVLALVAPHEGEPAEFERLRRVADVEVVNSAPALAAALEEAEILFVWDFRTRLLADAWPHARRLRWIQTNSVGVDAVAIDEVVASDVVLTNMRGVFEWPIAEYVLGLLLLFAKDMRRTLDLQARREWVHRETETLHGRRMLILGAGPIARAVARLAGAFGMEVDAVGRRARDGDEDFGRVHATGDVDGLLGQADVVVLALPLTAETRRFLDEERIGRMKRGARLVNIGRGALIDDRALIAALREGRVDAAGLDVFDPEPLPADHPYWELERVVVSPHMSADLIGWKEQAVDRFVENLGRWERGEPLGSVVDKAGLRAAPAIRHRPPA